MPKLTLAIVCGTLLAFYANAIPDPFWFAYLPIIIGLAAIRKEYRIILVVTASFLWASCHFYLQLEQRLSTLDDNRQFQLRAEIIDPVEVDAHRLRFYVRPLHIENYTGKALRRVRLNWYQTKILPQPGEVWQLQVKLKRPRGFVNPAGFDFERWLFVNQVDASGYVKASQTNRRLTTASRWNVNRFRQQLAASIRAACSDCVTTGLIQALTIGLRHDIAKAQNRLLIDTGTAHLLAISGLHVGMIAALFFALGRVIWRLILHRSGINQNQCSSVFALTAALAYAALAGFSLPTLRALLMLLVLFIVLLLKNRINLLQSLCWVVAVLLIADPLAVGSNSFWLTISAVMVIAFAQFQQVAKLSWWRQLIRLQLYFSLLFLPVGILIFDQLNPASIAANLLAIPMLGFIILPVVLLGAISAALELPWTSLLLQASDSLLGWLLDYLQLLVDVGLGKWVVASLPPFLLLLTIALFPLLLLWRYTALYKPALIILLVIIFWQPKVIQPGEFDLSVFDVGMGTSILLKTQTHSLVYDFGPSSRFGYSAADLALIPALRQQRIDQPDLLIISHVDQDHSGGFRSFLPNYEPARLLSGTPLETQARFNLNHRVRSCHSYPDWVWDGVAFSFISSATLSDGASTNNRSCVLLIEGRQRVLIPGDIEAVQEQKLVDVYQGSIRADLLVVPHHGSKTSSSRVFIESVQPAQVIFTLSHANRWGFPHPLVVERFKSIGSDLYRTDQQGAIIIQSRIGGMKIEALREQKVRIWR